MNKYFFAATAAYGWDTKPENRDKGFKLVSGGVSVHRTLVPAITVGAGGGVTRFFINREVANDFAKWYVQPVIIDVKPLTLFLWNPRFHSPWAHTLYIRYSGTVYLDGFRAGQFGLDQPAYPTEYINTLSIYFDVEPLLRDKRGKWWKDKP